MRVAVIRNKSQTFVVLKQEPACSILLQPLSLFHHSGGSWRLRRSIVSSHILKLHFFSCFVLLDVCLQDKSPTFNVGWNVDSSEIIRAIVWCQVFPVLMYSSALGRIRDTFKPLKKSWRWAFPYYSNSLGWLFRNSPDIIRNIYCICFWSYVSKNNIFFVFTFVSQLRAHSVIQYSEK